MVENNFSEKVSFIWSVADLLRGDFKQSEYGRVILPLTVLRRLDCVLEPTKEKVLAKAKSLPKKADEAMKDLMLCQAAGKGMTFYNTSKFVLQPTDDGEENRRVLQGRGLVVYLKTSVEQQLRRLGRDRSRPLLQTPDRRVRLEKLAEERNALYEEVADIEFPARNKGPDAVARQLAQVIRKHREQ